MMIIIYTVQYYRAVYISGIVLNVRIEAHFWTEAPEITPHFSSIVNK